MFETHDSQWNLNRKGTHGKFLVVGLEIWILK